MSSLFLKFSYQIRPFNMYITHYCISSQSQCKDVYFFSQTSSVLISSLLSALERFFGSFGVGPFLAVFRNLNSAGITDQSKKKMYL